jgi:hypothetical protein
VSNTVSTTSFINPTWTTVFGPQNYSPVTASLNTHTFSTPFVWNGTSNVLVDICFSNQVVGTSAYQNTISNPGFVSSVFYQADGTAGAGACTQATGTTTSNRPNMTLKHAQLFSVNSNAITMSVGNSSTPTVSISTTATTICAGVNAIFTAVASNAGSNPIYQWKVNGNNVGTNSATYSSNTLSNGNLVTCTITSNNPCSSTSTANSNTLTMTVTPPLASSVSITTSANNICSGLSVNFNAVAVNGGSPIYQWKLNGNNVGTNSAIYTTNTLNNGDQVSCEMTSSLSCVSPAVATSNTVIMNIFGSTPPTVTISPSSAIICDGDPLAFTANVNNGGNPIQYQWKINGSNVVFQFNL